MFKRTVCLLLMLALLCHCAALADGESFASYRLPSGAETVLVTDIRTLTVPEGVEAMYSVMGRVSGNGDTYIVRMPNGLALASVSWRPLRRSLTLDDLLAMEPQFAAALYQDFACVEVQSVQITDGYFGRETLTIRALAGETEGEYQLVGAAFPSDGVMYEIWTIAPTDASLPGLESDMQDMEFFINSVVFSSGVSYQLIDDSLSNVELPESRTYTDASNRFSVALPLDSQLLSPRSTPEERESIRQQYLSRNASGAELLFDQLMEDIDTEDATVVFCNGYQTVAEFFCEDVSDMVGMTTADFLSMGEAIAQAMTEDFGLALCLSSNEAVTLSGMDHCLLRLGIRTDDLSQYVSVLACIDGQGLLREIDLFTPADQGQAGANALLALLLQTLQYQ